MSQIKDLYIDKHDQSQIEDIYRGIQTEDRTTLSGEPREMGRSALCDLDTNTHIDGVRRATKPSDHKPSRKEK